jgi:hypothetical protein
LFSRRKFLTILAVQTLFISGSIPKFPKNPQSTVPEFESPEFIVVSGWVLLKSDLLELES